MRNKIFIFGITALSWMALSSCSKGWLDKKPNLNLTVPETLKDFEAMLDNTDLNAWSALSLGETGADGHYVLESRWATGFSDLIVNAYTWSNERPYVGLDDWNHPYNSIIVSNVILEGINKIEPSANNIEQWNGIMAGALFNRARHFYELAQVFCLPYEPNSTNSGLGLPIRIESDITISTSRSTIKQTYDQILSDLIAAQNLSPVKPLYKTRVSKPAVFALLARVYLSMRDYENAGKYSDSCLSLYSTLLDYNKIDPNTALIGIFNDEVIFHNLSIARNIFTTSGKIDQSLFDSYDGNDLRKKVFYNVEAAGTVIFKGNYHSSASNLFFGLATDEVYLIRAECFARTGNAIASMKDLNTLLKTRWNKNVVYVDLAATNAEDALSKILVERKKELILRGQRWTDLRRLNAEPQLAVTLIRTIGGKTYRLEPNSYKYTFPIPDDVIQLTGIPQNIGWSR